MDFPHKFFIGFSYPLPSGDSPTVAGGAAGLGHRFKRGETPGPQTGITATPQQILGRKRQHHLTHLEAIGCEDHDATEVGRLAPALDTIADKDVAKVEHELLVLIRAGTRK